MGLLAKWVLKGVMVSLLVSGAISYLFYLQTGRTPWSLLGIHSANDLLPDVPAPDLNQASNRLRAKVNEVADQAERWVAEDAQSETIVYRWRDAEGVTHYGETPPPGVTAELITVDPNRNLMQGLPEQKAREDDLSRLQELLDQTQQKQ